MIVHMHTNIHAIHACLQIHVSTHIHIHTHRYIYTYKNTYLYKILNLQKLIHLNMLIYIEKLLNGNKYISKLPMCCEIEMYLFSKWFFKLPNFYLERNILSRN